MNRIGLVSAAAMHDLHVIQGPNVTRDTREKIAFFAFQAFVVEDSRFQQNRVRANLYNCGACVCKGNVEIRIAGSFCRPQKCARGKFWTRTFLNVNLRFCIPLTSTSIKFSILYFSRCLELWTFTYGKPGVEAQFTTCEETDSSLCTRMFAWP